MGGYYQSWQKTPAGATVPNNAHGFTVDRLKLRMDGNVSDKTKVVLQNAFFVDVSSTDGKNNANYNVFGSRNFTSPAAFRLASGAAGTGLLYSLESAYVDHKFADGFHTWVGFFATPFGMESMWDRGDMPTYYYSAFYRSNYVGSGINNDLGVKFALTEMIPGTLEIAIMDGRGYAGTGPAHMSPSIGLRYSMEHKSGDMSLTPVASLYMAHWAGFAKYWMASLGAMAKMGALWGNLEFLYSTDQPNLSGVANTDGKNNRWSLVAEPGFDAGMVNLSAKVEFTNTTYNGGIASGTNKGQSDFNVGLAASHTYDGDYTVKLAYAMYGLANKNLGPGSFSSPAGFGEDHVNDLRLLFSTKW